MDKQEAIETLQSGWAVLEDWCVPEGLARSHEKRLSDMAIAITISHTCALEAVTRGIDVEVPTVGGVLEQATYLALASLVAAFQMGRASVLGDEQK